MKRFKVLFIASTALLGAALDTSVIGGCAKSDLDPLLRQAVGVWVLTKPRSQQIQQGSMTLFAADIHQGDCLAFKAKFSADGRSLKLATSGVTLHRE